MFSPKAIFENMYGLKTVGSATDCFRHKQFLKICMVLKQSGALPNVFAKSNFEIMYGLKTVGSATDCFRQKQFLKIFMVFKTVGSATECFRKKQILSIEQFLSTKIFLTIEYTKFWRQNHLFY